LTPLGRGLARYTNVLAERVLPVWQPWRWEISSHDYQHLRNSNVGSVSDGPLEIDSTMRKALVVTERGFLSFPERAISISHRTASL